MIDNNAYLNGEPVFWLGNLGGFDDFGRPYNLAPGGVMYDARMRTHNAWANMTPESFAEHGYKLGMGFGQKYEMQADGRWLKVEG